MSARLRFETLAVQVAPSFPAGCGFTVDDLSAGVNVIHGPNGIGKSTLARAAMEILTPGSSGWRRPTLAARVVHESEDDAGTAAYDVEMHAGESAWRQDGRVSDPPDAAGLRLVHLPLESLVRDADEHFAGAVARASQGGYDLSRAARELGWVAIARPRGIVRALRDARTERATAVAEHHRIEALDAEVAQLDRRLSSARAASTRVARLETLRERRRLEREAATLVARLHGLPPDMDRVRGDERSTLERLHREAEALTGQATAAARDRAEHERRLAALGPALPPSAAGVWRRAVDEIEDFELAQRAAERELAERTAQRDRTRQWLDDVDDSAPAPGAGDPHRAPALRAAARDLARAETRWRARAAAQEAAESARAPGAPGDVTGVAWISALVAFAATMALGLRVDPAWFGALIVPLAVAMALVRKRRRPPRTPMARGTTLEEERAALDARRTGLARELGVELSAEDEWLELLVRDAVAWRDADDAAARAQGAVEHAERALAQAVTRLGAQLAPLGMAVTGGATARSAVEALLERQERARLAAAELDASADREHDLRGRIDQLQQRMIDVYTSAGVEPGDDAALDERLGAVAEYRALIAEARATRLALERLPVRRDDVDDAPDDLATEIEAARGLAGQVEELSGQLGRAREAVDRAKARHDVEQALARESACLDELASARAAAVDAAIGSVLVDVVRREAQLAHRPAVFRRAADLLVRITRGRLELELDDELEAFAARDAITDAVRPLDALSVGERVQVLVAVRLGFAEHDADGCRLPIVLDETLGTADDERCMAMIDAVIELARAGHQVLSFTAQRDEVMRWQSRLDSAGVAHRLIDLAAIRGVERAARSPLPKTIPSAPTVPAPDGDTREAYGRRLGVPGLDPAVDNLDAVHLWHVVHDLDALHALLERGIIHLGQLRALRRHGGAGDALLGPGGYARIQARAQVIERAFESWRIGRGRPVDRSVLIESTCVSERFIDELAALAAEVGGDAKALISELEQSQRVAAWRRAKTEQLRAWLAGEGYLDERAIMDRDEMRAAVMAGVESDAASRVELGFVEGVLAGLVPLGELRPSET